MTSLTDMELFTKTVELVENDTEVLYEVVEKKAPKNVYTLKVFKETPKDYPALLDLLFQTNSDHPSSLGLKVFPKIYSAFKCRDKTESKICDCLLFEHVPSFFRILQKDFLHKPITFPMIYQYYQSFINALGYLEINGMFHGSLFPEAIGVSHEKGLKFMELENLNHGIGHLIESRTLNRDPSSPYLAPELKKAILEKKSLRFNGNKSDTFSMAIILLEMGGESIGPDVNLNDLEAIIAKKINGFRQRFENEVSYTYSEIFERFMSTLERCLSFNLSERHSPLELLKRSMQFVGKKYILSFLKTIEANSGKEDLFESRKSLERFEISSAALHSKYDWTISGKGSKGHVISCPDNKIAENLTQIERIECLNLEIVLPDPKKSNETKDLLLKFQEIIDEMQRNKRIDLFDSLNLQTSPIKTLCQTTPERTYFYNTLFKKGEIETEKGLRCFIGHDKEYWNGISNEILTILLNFSRFCTEMSSLRICLGSWLDITSPGISKIVEFIQKLSFRNLRNFEFGLYSHSADTISVNEIAECMLRGLKSAKNHALESLTFFLFSSLPQDPSISTLAEIIQFSPQIKDLNLQLRQLSKSANLLKLEESLTIPLISSLKSLKLGFASTTEPYLDDFSLGKLYAKISKGLVHNVNLNSLGIYLLTWGDIDKGFYDLKDLLREKQMTLDLYFYGKGPKNADEKNLHAELKEAIKKARISLLHVEFSNKHLLSATPTLKKE